MSKVIVLTQTDGTAVKVNFDLVATFENTIVQPYFTPVAIEKIDSGIKVSARTLDADLGYIPIGKASFNLAGTDLSGTSLFLAPDAAEKNSKTDTDLSAKKDFQRIQVLQTVEEIEQARKAIGDQNLHQGAPIERLNNARDQLVKTLRAETDQHNKLEAEYAKKPWYKKVLYLAFT